MPTIIYIILLSCLATACAESVSTHSVLPLDVGAAIDNPICFDLSYISESMEFIPLSTGSTRELICDIRRLGESDTGFYVMDDERSPVKLFSHSGQFIASRGIIGRGPNEFLILQNMTVDCETGNLYLYVYDGGAMNLFSYDVAGRLTARCSLGLGGSDGLVFYEGKVVLHRSSPLGYVVNHNNNSTIGTNIPLLDIFTPNLQNKETLYTADKGSGERIVMTKPSKPSGIGMISGFSSEGILSDNGNALLVKEERNDTVFCYREGRLEPTYVLSFGTYMFPVDAFGLNPTTEPGDSYLPLKILEGERFLFIECHGQENDVIVHLIFDKHKLSEAFSTVGTDDTPGLFINGIAFTPCYVRDNRLVGYMQAFDIVDNVDAITNQELKSLATTMADDDNPVIVIAKLKR